MKVAGDAATLLVLDLENAGGKGLEGIVALANDIVGNDEVGGVDGDGLESVTATCVHRGKDQTDNAGAFRGFNFELAFLARVTGISKSKVEIGPTGGRDNFFERV